MNETAVSIRPDDRFLTRAQEQIWAGQRMYPDAAMANMALLSWFEELVDTKLFVDAVDRTVQLHEALRTIYPTEGAAGVVNPVVVAKPPRRTEIVRLNAAQLDDWLEQRVHVPLAISECVYDSVLLECDGRHGWYMNIHHVATDATASAQVYQTAASIYAGEEAAGSRHREYVAKLALRETTDKWKRAEAHWQDFPALDRPPSLYHSAETPSVKSTRVRVELAPDDRRYLDEHLQGDLRALSHELGLAAVLVSAVAILRHRVGDDESTVIGVPIHNRDRSARSVVGCCIELFPLTLTVRAGESFRSVHRRALKAILNLMAFAQPGTSPTQRFDVVVNVSAVSLGSFGDVDATTRWLDSGAVDANHALRVQSFDWDGSGRVEFELDVNHAVANQAQRSRIGHHLGSVIGAMVRDLDTSIGNFALVTPDELAVTERFNSVGLGVKLESTVVDDFEASLNAHGSTVLVDGERSWNGEELLNRVHDVRDWLAGEGIGLGDKVGVQMRGTADAIIAIYAVLAAGAAFVPLDPDYPTARLSHIVADSALSIVLDELPATRDPGDASPIAKPTASLPKLGLDDLAYVLYTSGSTGQPKGVPITHRGLQEYLTFAADAYLDRAVPPTVPLFSSLSFDLTITSLFLPVLAGGTLHCHPVSGLPALREIVDDRRATMIKATPSHLELLVRMIDERHPLRTLIVGGEAFSRGLADRLRNALGPDVRIFNEYGPTEAVVGCMIHQYDPDLDTGSQVPIGVPAPGAQLFVLDSYGHHLPLGVEGELYLHRPGMTSGYLNRPALNEERFVNFPAISPNALYRSGDRVRLTESGTNGAEMDFLGRMDEQLKVQGVRLDPGEVESGLLEHPEISAVAVRAWNAAVAATAFRHCSRCGVPSNVPGVHFAEHDICETCMDFESLQSQAEVYFRTMADMSAAIAEAATLAAGDHDVLHLLSGGKDSTYALYKLVAAGARVRAMTLDNGFISEGAKSNARRACADLGVVHEIVTTPAMNEIFRDSLERFSNVCNGCYKALYTLAITAADKAGIPLVSTGLSRGQLFETRLTPGQLALDRFDPSAIDAAVLAARKVYHRTDDAVSRLLDVSVFADDSLFERVRFLDFFRYVDVELQDMLDFLDEHTTWERPTDTGRSTNCLINVAGISVHRMEQGFHNYALPYSWDVRLGHKTRDAAMAELDDHIDEAEVTRLLAEVGYEPRRHQLLTAWYVADRSLPLDELRNHLAARIPAHAIPAAFVRIDAIPLNANGKVATEELPAPVLRGSHSASGYVAPSSGLEETLAAMWSDVLGIDEVGVNDDFFELGGTSLRALEMIVWVSDHFETSIAEATAFEHRTIRLLAVEIERVMIAEIAGMSDDEVRYELGEP